MIIEQSYLKVADNTGAREIKIIHVLNSQVANIGDKVIAVVKEALPNMSIKKADIVTAVVVRTKKGIN
uniref:ribosomal protein L14 n=1 Tax=Trentepohlia sp. BN17 TaxID=3063876 RepID=UPI001EDEC89F|nr:ribosomal protein L14 [Trentepohlia sp. BN17]UIB38712.1 ribosomal protein L14 [Trentepohlia sp. BN17]